MSGAALGFVLPAALALAAPALFAWWRWGRPAGGRWFGLVALLLLVLAAAQPELAWGRGGSDVVLVLDRSSSMAAARGRQEELLRLVGDQRRAGDRLAVVMVGEGACVAQGPQRTDLPSLADHPMGEGASDLAAALEQAGALFAPGRTGRVILHSDGEATGADPRRAAARRCPTPPSSTSSCRRSCAWARASWPRCASSATAMSTARTASCAPPSPARPSACSPAARSRSPAGARSR